MGAQLQLGDGHDGIVGNGAARWLMRRRDDNEDSARHDGRRIGLAGIELRNKVCDRRKKEKRYNAIEIIPQVTELGYQI